MDIEAASLGKLRGEGFGSLLHDCGQVTKSGDSQVAASSVSVPPSSASCSLSAAAGAVSQPHSSPVANMAEVTLHQDLPIMDTLQAWQRSPYTRTLPILEHCEFWSRLTHEVSIAQIRCQYLGSVSV